MKKCQVLLLGDSISVSYRDKVKAKLSHTVNVYFPAENGKFCAYTFRMLYDWNKEYSWPTDMDIVYWNNGLWDVVRIFGDEPQTSPEGYRNDIIRCYQRLRYLFPKAKIVFALTTPVQEAWYRKDFLRRNEDIRLYNEIAREEISRLGGEIDDFSDLVQQHGAELYKDATHFRNKGCNLIAAHAAESIKAVLQTKMFDVEQDAERQKKEDQREFLTALRNFAPVVAYGAGEMFCEHISQLKMHGNFTAVCDQSLSLQGQTLHGLPCIPPVDIENFGRYVIITAIRPDIVEEIRLELKQRQIDCIALSDALEVVEENQIELEERFLDRKFPHGMKDADPNEDVKLKKYISIHVPANVCNLRCRYCYVGQLGQQNKGLPRINHSPRYIRYLLSKENVGGTALINLCGAGETLLCDKIVEICKELLMEGHSISIVTNGLITKQIKKILQVAGEYAKHLFFKISFHYEQLKKKNLLDVFKNNVQFIESSDASYTLELMPHDELIPYIDEIKTYSMQNFGAYPHLTIGRDDTNASHLLSGLSLQEYKRTWEVFHSSLFDYKIQKYIAKTTDCYAGKLGLQIDLLSGSITNCYAYSQTIGNLYKANSLEFPAIEKCSVAYCYNCHAWGSLGVIPEKGTPSYYEFRDRVSAITSNHWVKESIRKLFVQKIYENDDEELLHVFKRGTTDI